eukprot:Sspe_Gene.94493::Locus_66867_Transcript_1_1_Confidence_1.000_Length_711::g.94493::m.94493
MPPLPTDPSGVVLCQRVERVVWGGEGLPTHPMQKQGTGGHGESMVAGDSSPLAHHLAEVCGGSYDILIGMVLGETPMCCCPRCPPSNADWVAIDRTNPHKLQYYVTAKFFSHGPLESDMVSSLADLVASTDVTGAVVIVHPDHWVIPNSAQQVFLTTPVELVPYDEDFDHSIKAAFGRLSEGTEHTKHWK